MKDLPRRKYTKLPVSIGLKNFRLYVDRHLSRGKHGPKPKIGRHRVFNYILYVLHTGMPWNALRTVRGELHWTNVYKWHLRWSKDGSYERLFEASVRHLHALGGLDLSVLHGDGTNTVAKKGAKASAIPATSTRKA